MEAKDHKKKGGKSSRTKGDIKKEKKGRRRSRSRDGAGWEGSTPPRKYSELEARAIGHP